MNVSTRAILGALAVTACALTVAGCGLIEPENSTTNAYDVPGSIGTLSLTGRGGNVTVDTADSGPIKVTESLRYNDTLPKTSHKVDGTTLTLVDDGCGHGNCQVDYAIRIPRGTTVRITTSGGDITGHGLGADATVETSGGNIDLDYARAADAVSANSSGGDVTIKVPSGPYDVDAKTAGGTRTVSVPTVAGATHRIAAKSSGGNVTVQS